MELVEDTDVCFKTEKSQKCVTPINPHNEISKQKGTSVLNNQEYD